MKLDLILENVRMKYSLNLLEESEGMSEKDLLKGKILINEATMNIRSMLVEEGGIASVQAILEEAWVSAIIEESNASRKVERAAKKAAEKEAKKNKKNFTGKPGEKLDSSAAANADKVKAKNDAEKKAKAEKKADTKKAAQESAKANKEAAEEKTEKREKKENLVKNVKKGGAAAALLAGGALAASTLGDD